MENFNQAIYLTYIELGQKFKLVTKEEYYDKLYNHMLNKRITIELPINLYRLADTKEIWLSINNKTLGNIWKQDKLISYWINLD